ncbi:uncharacterized protein METZ01_LOCUS269639, partial [marine metagenome]
VLNIHRKEIRAAFQRVDWPLWDTTASGKNIEVHSTA